MTVKNYLHSTVVSLMEAVPQLEATAMSADDLQEIVARGFFRPSDDEEIAHWFARFLTQREALWAVINEVDAGINVPLGSLRETEQWRQFLLGYAAACLLVRQDRFLLFSVATHTLIQRKLNEAFPEYRIARKQYSAIFSGYTDPFAALSLYEAMRVARRRRRQIAALVDDPIAGVVVRNLPELESHLDPSKRNYLKRLFQFLSHRWRRRGASARQQTVFAVLEGFGRTASLINPGKTKCVTEKIREQIHPLLRPGDVLISRHRYALTNYLLPGNWPHASLYIGTPEQRAEYGIVVEPEVAARWSDGKCTLEALRDGVLFRPLSETLNVDSFVLLRPALDRAGIAEAIQRVVRHEGKSYNFDFDFFSSDKLVCTEVIYRALDGIKDIVLPLVERAGRQSLSAEDLLDLALDTDMFEPLAIFGCPPEHGRIITGAEVIPVLIASYRGAFRVVPHQERLISSD